MTAMVTNNPSANLDDHHVVVMRALCTTTMTLCLALLASWPPPALAAPVLLPRQADATTNSNPKATGTTTGHDAVVGVLSAVAAVVALALAAVVTLVYCPEATKRFVRQVRMRFPVVTTSRSTTETPSPPLKPEIINTTTTTTVTHHTDARTTSVDDDGDDKGFRSSIGSSSSSSPGASEFDLAKHADLVVPRPPSSAASSSRYSCHVSSDYTSPDSARASRYPSALLSRASSRRHTVSGLLQKPISWLRSSSSTAANKSSRGILGTKDDDDVLTTPKQTCQPNS